MSKQYDELDNITRAALARSTSEVIGGLGERLTVHRSNEAMITKLAKTLLADYLSATASGHTKVAMIVPVGPVGQYDIFARISVEQGVDLRQLTLIVMDEYLTNECNWINQDDALSFRSHIERHLLANLPTNNRPEIVVPDPHDLAGVQQAIDRAGGVETTFAGVGITGHLAFNEPMEGVEDPGYFASLPTRIVPLLAQTRLINSVTAARGNVARIPRMAVTVGMKEILSARRVRIFMNRHWQAAAIRRLAFGPVTASFPASLVQTHQDWSLDAVEEVLLPAEPQLA